MFCLIAVDWFCNSNSLLAYTFFNRGNFVVLAANIAIEKIFKSGSKKHIIWLKCHVVSLALLNDKRSTEVNLFVWNSLFCCTVDKLL